MPCRAPWRPRASEQAGKRRGPRGLTQGRGRASACPHFTLSAQSWVFQEISRQHLPSNLFCVNLPNQFPTKVLSGVIRASRMRLSLI